MPAGRMCMGLALLNGPVLRALRMYLSTAQNNNPCCWYPTTSLCILRVNTDILQVQNYYL